MIGIEKLRFMDENEALYIPAKSASKQELNALYEELQIPTMVKMPYSDPQVHDVS